MLYFRKIYPASGPFYVLRFVLPDIGGWSAEHNRNIPVIKTLSGANPLSMIVICLILVGCEDKPVPMEEIVPRVKYFQIGEQASGQSRRISGKVVAAETSPLSFAIGGTVEEVLVAQGDVVHQGQLLVRLDEQPLGLAVEQGRAQLKIAHAKVAETKQTYDRTVDLLDKRAASKAELESAIANHAAARGNLRSAQSDLDRKERDLSRAKLTAPFAGAIASRSIEPFQEISAGQEAFVLQSSDSLEVEVRVPETLIRDVDYGQVVKVSFPTLKQTTVSGVVSEIGSRAEAGNAFPVSILLSSTDADLRPGITASVTFNFDKYLNGRTVYMIPLSALAIEVGMLRKMRAQSDNPAGEKVPVFVIDDTKHLRLRNIVVGDLRGNKLEVYEGLEAGERIASAGVAFLREGMNVEFWSPEQGLTDG